MYRMGKKQELKRGFRFISIFSFCTILMSTWEAQFPLGPIALFNGGTAGFIWGFFLCWIGFLLINTSLAEMGSMAPTTGGQYHWISEFAPRKYQRFMSYMMGWICVLGWQSLCATAAYASGTQIQFLAVLNYPDYVPETWHGSLITIAIAAYGVFFNTWLAKKLPLIEGIVLILHVLGFFAILVPLWVLSPRIDAKTAFTVFNNGGGWNNMAASFVAGIASGIGPLLGADAAVHMSEELQDASRVVPRAMFWTTFFNGLAGWIGVITFCFCIDSLEVLESPLGAYVQVLLNSTQSAGATTAMSAVIIALGIFGQLTMVATASRQLFAFARDDAIPFHGWFSYVKPGWDVPFNSIITTFITTSLLSLIGIGSSVALNSILSLTSVAILSSYICSIGCIIWRRVTHQPLLPSKFDLGRWGLPINIVSEIFCIFFFVSAFFPPAPNPTPDIMNWSIVIYSGTLLVSLLYYFFYGRHNYAGPVEYVRKLD
ncbi:amino acid transporter [Massarina eburnea CBS 473.64]|uniref:Amino acid transporter n=1 Tax=Massarina eburnea CBS 473.64 TaxID=1395130 RepID=A0A6A6RXB4_9PLEO|nr:amino acid transporter [Massarina eburnea CBS 473.64]